MNPKAWVHLFPRVNLVQCETWASRLFGLFLLAEPSGHSQRVLNDLLGLTEACEAVASALTHHALHPTFSGLTFLFFPLIALGLLLLKKVQQSPLTRG